ncbi:nucleotide-diphospho-sugar transferase [Meredithblackwellia eburnea MCA 4105]
MSTAVGASSQSHRRLGSRVHSMATHHLGQKDLALSKLQPLSATKPTLITQTQPDSKSTANFILRASIFLAILLTSTVSISYRNPSPWTTNHPSLFVRPPPPLEYIHPPHVLDLSHHPPSPPSDLQFNQNEQKQQQSTASLTPAPLSCQNPLHTTLLPREKAAIVLLVRSSDLPELLPTLRNFEAKFNGAFRYPYVFFTDPDDGEGQGAFSAQFKAEVLRVLPPRADVRWETIARDHWKIPGWLDERRVREGFKEMGEREVMFGDREGYHHMCRWYSGLFARHPALKEFDWWWRLEPGVRFFCQVTYDPFRFLSLHKKVYGFVITVVENENTIPTLFDKVKEYGEREAITPRQPEGLWAFMSKKDKGVEEYSKCHFWTNFEIGDLRFFRSSEYQSFFDALDREGGFYTERWGDAPVRSLGLGLLAEQEQIHYFEDFGYQHDLFIHCPQPRGTRRSPANPDLGCECDCPRADGKTLVDMDVDWKWSCLEQWKATQRKARRAPRI